MCLKMPGHLSGRWTDGREVSRLVRRTDGRTTRNKNNDPVAYEQRHENSWLTCANTYELRHSHVLVNDRRVHKAIMNVQGPWPRHCPENDERPRVFKKLGLKYFIYLK